MLKEAHTDIWYNHVADKKQENLLHEQQQTTITTTTETTGSATDTDNC